MDEDNDKEEIKKNVGILGELLKKKGADYIILVQSKNTFTYSCKGNRSIMFGMLERLKNGLTKEDDCKVKTEGE